MEMMQFLEADKEQLMSGLAGAGTPEKAQSVLEKEFDAAGRENDDPYAERRRGDQSLVEERRRLRRRGRNTDNLAGHRVPGRRSAVPCGRDPWACGVSRKRAVDVGASGLDPGGDPSRDPSFLGRQDVTEPQGVR